MFELPVTATSDFIRNSLETQISVATKMYENMIDTSMQFGHLNVQAARKLVEESTAAAEKGMGLKTLAETQAFIVEQSQLTFDRLSGYSRNAQKIATRSVGGLDKAVEVTVAQQAAPARDRVEQAEEEHAAPHGQQHEVDPHPSVLVEKLISSVVNDADHRH